MTDEKRYKIAVLAEDCQRKQEVFDALRLMTTPSTPEDRIKARIELAIAQAEYNEAHTALASAIYGA